MQYIDDDQIIEEATRALIAAHLSWSGSAKGMPSEDRDGIRSQVACAYLEAQFSESEWEAADESTRQLARDAANAIYRDAAKKADRKWHAAMLLLGMDAE